VLAYLSQLDDALVELLQAQAVLGSSATLEELAGVLYVPAGAAEDGCWCGCVRWVCGGARAKHTAASCEWAALTPTERQVADVVRRGLTNLEIAAHLYVSPRTVQSHVSHILAKFDLRSRMEIAARCADVASA
jgi:DNA-binding NarL/FixJ family response regulator